MPNFQVVDKISHDFVKAILKFENVKTDNWVFRLHYKFSTWLVVFYSLCYMYAMFKRPINCMGSNSEGKEGMRAFRKDVADYCWVHGTYTVTNLDPAEEIFPGIGVMGRQDLPRQHHYYKWMYFYMAATIILLLVPRQVWRNIENGKMRALVKKLQGVILNKDEDIEKEKESLVDYLYWNVGYHQRYAYGFVFAELLNVMVSLIVMMTWDLITEHEFSMHGTVDFTVMQTPPRHRTDRLTKVFPLLGRCVYSIYGFSGNIEPHDFLCILPLNVMNERAALFFWYYFMMLLAFGIGALVFRIALIGSKRLRRNLLSDLTPLTPPEDLEIIMKTCGYSDWFVIYQLGSSVEPCMFRMILEKLIRKLRDSEL